MKTSKQVTIKVRIAERLRAFPGSYSEAIEELFKIKDHVKYIESALHVEQEKNKQLLERIEVLRLAKRRKGGKYGNRK